MLLVDPGRVDEEKVEALLPDPLYFPAYPLARNFVGRSSYRHQLTSWWSSASEPVCAIVELGGMGKSSLAWFWLHFDLRRTGSDSTFWAEIGKEPEGIVWFSFYEPEASFSSFLDMAHRYFIGPKSEKGVSVDGVVAAMRKHRSIVVLDGLERQLLGFSHFDQAHRDETEEDSIRYCVDKRLAKFLTQALIPGSGSKILITSRLLPKELDDPAGVKQIRLAGLTEDEAIKFLEIEALGVDRGTLENVALKYAGHPLALRLAAGLLNDPQNRHLALPKDDDPVIDSLKQRQNHVLQVAFDTLEEGDKLFLSTLSAFRGATSFEAAAAVSDAGDNPEFWEQVGRLVDRGFLWTNRNQRLFDLHPIVRLFAYSRLVDKAGAAERISDFFESIPRPRSLSSLQQAEPIIEICYQYTRSNRFDEAWRIFATELWMVVGVKLGEYLALSRLIELFFPKGWAEESPLSIELQPELLERASSILNALGKYGEVIDLLSGRQNKAPDENLAKLLAVAFGATGRFSDAVSELRGALASSYDEHSKGHIFNELVNLFANLRMPDEATVCWHNMKAAYRKARMLDNRHLFEITCSEFDLATSLSREGKLLTKLYSLADLLQWKTAFDIVAGRKVGFLLRRLEKARDRSAIILWILSERPGENDAILLEDIINELLLKARNSGDLDQEARLLSMVARLMLTQNDISRARATAAESLRIAQDIQSIFTKMACLEVMALVEARSKNEQEKAQHLKAALRLLPDDPLASMLRQRITKKLGADKL